ncbi:hypothetical protein F5883DRAFT_583251 [Diaporthe sp. PMI_573]|nr:hypothetical protein F5883DRAFT_583251 [Diaporthaceae sp. PMI_573]
MAYESLCATDKSHNQHQYPSPDATLASRALSATSVPPSPPLSASPSSPSSSSTSLPASVVSIPPCPHVNLPQSVIPAFESLQELHRGQYTGPAWARYTGVTTSNVEALDSAARSAGIYKWRYDYDPHSESLTLRMPEGQPHNYVKNGLKTAIWDRLKARLDLAIQRLEGDDPSSIQAQSLRSIKAAIIPLVEAHTVLPSGTEKVPDVSFSYRGSRYPPLVIEVGHSQKSEELPALAREYIGDTGGDICTAITIDLGYRNRAQRTYERRRQREEHGSSGNQRMTRSMSRQRHASESRSPSATSSRPSSRPSLRPSTISLFRLGTRVLHDEVFRDAQGEKADGGFELNLADFVPHLSSPDEPVPSAVLESLSFTVPFSDLCNALQWGEEQQTLAEKTPTPQPEARPNRKRVHFDWTLLETSHEDIKPSERQHDSTSTSKRRKTGPGERLYRGRSRSQSQSGRQSSRSRQAVSEQATATATSIVERRRSSSRIQGQQPHASTNIE